jgi:predicted MFS family arabinose efflux permease
MGAALEKGGDVGPTSAFPDFQVWSLYLQTIVSMASVGVLIPVLGDLGATTGASEGSLGLALALFSAPSAILAGIGGSLIDRIGYRPALIWGAVLAGLADGGVIFARSPLMLDLAMAAAGLGFTAVTIAAPAQIMRVTTGAAETRAMALWSTYPPAGLSLGLLLGSPFAGGALWRWAIAGHLAVTLLALGLALGLPRGRRVLPAQALKLGVGDLLTALGQIAVVRVSLAAGLASAMAYGVTLILPSYLSQVRRLPMAEASSLLALANLATILGGIAAGYLMSLRLSVGALYGLVAALAGVALCALFASSLGFGFALVALVLWLTAIGSCIAIAIAALPGVIVSEAHAAASWGLMSQVISILSFLAPAVYFSATAGGRWMATIWLGGLGLAISWVAMSAPRKTPTSVSL